MKGSQVSDWRPTAPIENLIFRAASLKSIRDFFAARDVLEVETPLLCRHSVTDPYIQSISASLHINGKENKYFLQTSPEYAMKRLLAAGSGSIFQICKAFRQDEIGRLHNPEFTMLEWYRPGFDHHALMDEVDALLQAILQTQAADKFTYAELFQQYLGINPHTATLGNLFECLAANNIELSSELLPALGQPYLQSDDLAPASERSQHDFYLQLLLSHCIEPKLAIERPCFIYDFPASQAALSRIQPGNPPLAARFEVYYQGIELANGFHELADANEQRKRFERNCLRRQQMNVDEMTIDENLLAALAAGIPDCSGVALGLDRLIMLASKSTHLSPVISFDLSNA